MGLSRRDFIRTTGSGLATLALVPTLSQCSGYSIPEHSHSWGLEDMFADGVASGDPLPRAVILWTRVNPGETETAPQKVFVEIAMDTAFTDRVASQSYQAIKERDYTLKVDAINLSPGTTYYYRFSCMGYTSSVGRTRTAPEGRVDHLRFAACSCSNYAYGYFHSYRHLSQRADIDAVIHLGDYIYEYADGGYGNIRKCDPSHEIVTLDDYRTRYRQYRRDPDLQEVHRQHPFITVWDDHEFCNNPEEDGLGADNHQPATEGDWQTRVDAAVQAYNEWMPIRTIDPALIYRNLPYGTLAQITCLDIKRPLLAPVEGEKRTRLGMAQTVWLDQTISETTARWLILAQQQTFATERDTEGNGGGSWDRFPGSRERIQAAVEAQDISNVVVLTGDIHQAQACDIAEEPYTAYNPETGEGSWGVEVIASSITSPGSTRSMDIYPHKFWSEGWMRGYMIFDIKPERMQVDWYGYFDLLKAHRKLPDEQWWKGYITTSGNNHLVEANGPAPQKETAPVLAPEN